MRIPAAVRGNQTVAVKVLVRCGITSLITSVHENLLSIGVFAIYRLVHKVPDKAALNRAVGTDNVPVLLESALGVTHGVGVLALYHGTRVVAAFMALHGAVISVHRAVYIAMVRRACSTLILHGAGLVILLDPLVAGHKVLAVAILVTH